MGDDPGGVRFLAGGGWRPGWVKSFRIRVGYINNGLEAAACHYGIGRPIADREWVTRCAVSCGCKLTKVTDTNSSATSEVHAGRESLSWMIFIFQLIHD